MSTKVGRQAEDTAALYLQRLGYEVLGQNWRTRWCEIDLIVSKDQAVHFVEVKYRSSLFFGSGLDYITSQKLQQMHFAADFWLSRNSTHAQDYSLGAIELTGQPPRVTQWLADVT